MKRFIITLAAAWAISSSMSAAETTVQKFYFDFGTITASQGTVTASPDANSNHWNNITNNTSGNKYAAAGTVYDGIVNSQGEATGIAVTLNSRFSTNGKSGGGGLLTPSADLLGDFAIATATEDYFFIEASESDSKFTISGLNPANAYRFRIFASRNAKDNRTGLYTMSGMNSFTGELQLAGTDLGGPGINQNIANILTSDPIFPDNEGKIVFNVTRKSGQYIALNVLAMEELSGIERPAETIVEVTAKGNAVENGSLKLVAVNPDGVNEGVYQGFAEFGEGTFRIEGVTNGGTVISYGVADGKISADAADYSVSADSDRFAMIQVNTVTGEFKLVPFGEFALVGGFCGWGFDNAKPLTYRGGSVWGPRDGLHRCQQLQHRDGPQIRLGFHLQEPQERRG